MPTSGTPMSAQQIDFIRAGIESQIHPDKCGMSANLVVTRECPCSQCRYRRTARTVCDSHELLRQQRDEALGAMASDGADAVSHNAVLRGELAALTQTVRAQEARHKQIAADGYVPATALRRCETERDALEQTVQAQGATLAALEGLVTEFHYKGWSHHQLADHVLALIAPPAPSADQETA